jgi:hypothetical protein
MNTSQMEHAILEAGESQEDVILGYLQANLGREVPMPRLYEISGSMAVHSRISSLRRRGVSIINRVDRSSRPYKSYYKLAQP